MVLGLLYSIVRSVLDLPVLCRKTEAALQIEVLALRHQLRVLECHVHLPRFQPADRLLLSDLDLWGAKIRPALGLPVEGAEAGTLCIEESAQRLVAAQVDGVHGVTRGQRKAIVRLHPEAALPLGGGALQPSCARPRRGCTRAAVRPAWSSPSLERQDRRAGDRRPEGEARGCGGAEPGCSARRTPSGCA